MAKTKAFNMAELIRHLNYNATNDTLETTKSIKSEGKVRKTKVTTTTSQQEIDSFVKADYSAAQYIITASRGGEFHTTVILINHDSTTAFDTQYADVMSDAVIATYAGNVSGSTIQLLATPVATNTTFKFQVEFVDA